MPLIEIVALPQAETVNLSSVVQRLNRAVAEAIPCRVNAVWTIWRTVTGPYGHGEDIAFEQRAETHPPIAHVYLRRTAEETSRVVETIERVLAGELGVSPGNVFVTVQSVEHVEPVP